MEKICIIIWNSTANLVGNYKQDRTGIMEIINY